MLTINRKEFSAELAILAGFVEPKSTIPVLNNVLFSSNGKLTMTATDLEIGITSDLETSDGETVTVTAPLKAILAHVKRMNCAEIGVQLESSRVSIVNGSGKASFPGISAESYPELPKAPADGGIIVRGLGDMIRKTIHAVSTVESRFTLNGALLEIKGGQARMVATDGHRMVISESQCEAGELRALIPLNALKRLAGIADSWMVSRDENHVYFENGHRTVISRAMAGNFPDYQRVIPRDFAGEYTVSRIALLKAIERTLPFADDRSHAIKILKAEGMGPALTVTASTEAGEYTESVKASIGAESASMVFAGPHSEDKVEYLGIPPAGLNGEYLVEALKALAADDVVLKIGRPGDIRCFPSEAACTRACAVVGDLGTLEVIMPMRI